MTWSTLVRLLRRAPCWFGLHAWRSHSNYFRPVEFDRCAEHTQWIVCIRCWKIA